MPSDSENRGKQDGTSSGWLRRHWLQIAGLLIVLAITITIFLLYLRDPERFKELEAYGYLGAFVVSIIFNATLILPAGNMLVLMTLASTLPVPVLVGLAGGAGAAIGEITGYVAGRSGRGLVSGRKIYGRIEGWVRRWGWLTIFVMSIVPFIFDLVGIAAGAVRYPFWRFLLFCWLGRTVFYVAITVLAGMGLKEWIPDWFF
jgi:membrane protein YqaA with SNARE-associated domain